MNELKSIKIFTKVFYIVLVILYIILAFVKKEILYIAIALWVLNTLLSFTMWQKYLKEYNEEHKKYMEIILKLHECGIYDLEELKNIQK